MVSIVLLDLILGDADEESHPSVDEGAHDKLLAYPGAHIMW